MCLLPLVPLEEFCRNIGGISEGWWNIRRLANIKKEAYLGSLILWREYLYLGHKSLEKWCCGDRLMFNLGAPIGIPCYFIPKSTGLNFGENNMVLLCLCACFSWLFSDKHIDEAEWNWQNVTVFFTYYLHMMAWHSYAVSPWHANLPNDPPVNPKTY